jgi:methylated-DNA-protein-cysteine methyltransferase-like protein
MRSARVPAAQRAPGSLETFRERVFAWIRRIPRGQVATYGQIAALAGYPRQARRVGQALGSLGAGAHPGPKNLPWQRVINSQGRVSARAPRPERALGARETEQERRLRAEGIVFVKGKTDLERFRWRPRATIPRPGPSPAPRKGPRRLNRAARRRI